MNRADFWLNELDRLENVATSVQTFSRDQIHQWAADSVAVFVRLVVPSDIIRGFMNLFEQGDSYYVSNSSMVKLYENWNSPARQMDRIKGFFYPHVAFASARTLARALKEQERLVPQVTIEELRQNSPYTHLATSLESIEAAYQSEDVENLLAASGALLFAIINLHSDSELQKLKRQPKKQLEFLLQKQNSKTLDDFGADRELIELFHNFRYLRNVLSQHKKSKIPRPPLAVGFGFASLVLIFLYGVMAQGALIK